MDLHALDLRLDRPRLRRLAIALLRWAITTTTLSSLAVVALVVALSLTGCVSRAANPEPPVQDESDVVLQAPLLDGMGTHTRSISSDVALTRRFFDQGLVLYYGFNHAEAERSFREAARLDPTCGVCLAFAALSLGPNINAPMSAGDVDPAWQAVQQAMRLAESAPAHELALIDAISQRYDPDPDSDRTELDERYARAIGAVHRAWPDDADVAALYAEALMDLHPWDYWRDDGTPQPWTPGILQTIEATFALDPDHPMAHHLYIHAVEASPAPELGLHSAEVLAELVPGAGHLVHMPAHIYINTGDYHAASTANEQAVAADEAYLEQVAAQGVYPALYHPHNYHFLWATTLLEGRRTDSLDAARRLAAHVDADMMRMPGMEGMQHFVATPLYAMVAFGLWDEILVEPAPADDLLFATAIWHYARGMALTALGRLDDADDHLARVRRAATDPRLADATFMGRNALPDLLQVATSVLSARLATARGDIDAAIAHYEDAIAVEDSLLYDEPPPWGPAVRRYLGALLLEYDRAAEAEAIYREDLDDFPRNGWSLYGLAESLRAQGERSRAERVLGDYELAWAHADLETPRVP